MGCEPNTLTAVPLRSWSRLDGDSLNTSRSRKKRMVAWLGTGPPAPICLVCRNDSGGVRTHRFYGALSRHLSPLGHTVHVMLPRCEHDGFCHWLVLGEAPQKLLQGSPTQDAPFASRNLSRKFSLVTRVSLVRLARFPWPRKDDTHRSVTAFFSRFPWPQG